MKEERREKTLNEWVPRTKTGKLVQSGEIKTFDQLYQKNMPVLEHEIIDFLFPELQENVLDVNMVRRVTDSGRKGSFVVTVAVGDGNGHIGIGTGKALSVRPGIERAIQKAKLNMAQVIRGCGSWECGCGNTHSVPFKVTGKARSVQVTLIPAPRGTGLVCGETAKVVLRMAGVTDVWCRTEGQTKTTFNFAKATFDALKQTRKMRRKSEEK